MPLKPLQRSLIRLLASLSHPLHGRLYRMQLRSLDLFEVTGTLNGHDEGAFLQGSVARVDRVKAGLE